MRGVRLTLNERHRNWRFYKLWLLIGLSFAILAIKAATGKRGDDQEQQCYKAWKVCRAKSRAAIVRPAVSGSPRFMHHASKNTKYRVLPTIFNVPFYRWEHC